MVKVSQAELVQGAIAGQAVSFPTDTVPALAIKPEFAQRIYQLKQRPGDKPLILMAASLADLLPYVVYTPSELAIWQQLIDQFLPGALTLVLPASNQVPPAINPTNTRTVGIRIPDHAQACQILKQTGVLATTSANISGSDALTTMIAIEQTFPDVLVLEDLQAESGSGEPSTVVGWHNQQWQVLRQGSIIINNI
jgi:L-threonylcarbamoyladenylate synthase